MEEIERQQQEIDRHEDEGQEQSIADVSPETQHREAGLFILYRVLRRHTPKDKRLHKSRQRHGSSPDTWCERNNIAEQTTDESP